MNSVFILFPNSFLNSPNIDLRKLTNNQLSISEIKLINQNDIKISLTFDEIISLKNKNIDFYIVNETFLSKIGIKKEYFSQLNIIYYEENELKFLYFINESRLLMLERTKITNFNQQIIYTNNIIFEKEDDNDNNNDNDNENILDNIYSICQNIKNFNESIISLKDQVLDLSDINNIENYLSQNLLIYLPIYIIKYDTLNYLLNSFNFEFLSTIEESEYNLMKEDINTNLNLQEIYNINYNNEILSPSQILENIEYSFINEEFCKKLKLQTKKYKSFIGFLFSNQKNLFIYFKNPQNLFKLNNYSNNCFNLVKSIYNKDNINLNNSNISNKEEDNINYKNIILELEKEKNENKKLNNIINQLKKELNNEKTNNISLSSKITLLENTLSQDKNKINELNELINAKINEINDLRQKLNNNIVNNSLKNVGPNEKNIKAIHFTTTDQKFHYCIPCKNTDYFVKCEELLHNEFPEYKDYDNIYFMGKGNSIKRFKTLDENKIKSGDTVFLNFFDIENIK